VLFPDLAFAYTPVGILVPGILLALVATVAGRSTPLSLLCVTAVGFRPTYAELMYSAVSLGPSLQM
jgi:hypothetical protein